MPRRKANPLGPTPERMAHGGIDQIPADRAGVVKHIARVQDALDWYHARTLLGSPAENGERYEAARQLRQAWHESGLEGSTVGSYVPAVQSARDPDGRMVGALSASRAYGRMMRMMGEHAGVVDVVCCRGVFVGQHKLSKVRDGLALLVDGLRLGPRHRLRKVR